jgi:hypothetical protein
MVYVLVAFDYSIISHFSMKKYNLLRFKYVSQLNLLDLKAQKKNIHYKRFLDLPLTL